MDGLEGWDDWGDPDAWESIEDPEFLLPSPGLALAQRLVGARSRASRAAGRKIVQAAGGPRPSTPMPAPMRGELAKIYETMKRLEEKHDEQAKLLAALQSRSAGLQSADVFKQALSAATANALVPLANGDLHSAAVHLAPLLQSSQGAMASITAKPISTLAFPLGALAVYGFRKPKKPEIIVTNRTRAAAAAGAAAVQISIVSRDPGIIRYQADNQQVTKNSPEYKGQFDLAANNIVRARVYSFWSESEQAELNVTVV